TAAQATTPRPASELEAEVTNSPNIGTRTLTLSGDPRILPVGRFLRRSKINELPQLFNILFGDMSFVGPRPQTKEAFDAFSASQREAISTVKPGLTGVGSIVFRNEERLLFGHPDPLDYYRCVIAPYKAELELWFIFHRSLRLYFCVIFITAWVVMFPDSKIVWNLLVGLPKAPIELAPRAGWPN
ncbi:MAG: sugar transferase, partial [Pseudomonadota bacterium]